MSDDRQDQFENSVLSVEPTNGWTSEQAQTYHERRQADAQLHWETYGSKPEGGFHLGGCWCCCWDCDAEGVETPAHGDLVLADGTAAKYADITLEDGEQLVDAIKRTIGAHLDSEINVVVDSPEALESLREAFGGDLGAIQVRGEGDVEQRGD